MLPVETILAIFPGGTEVCKEGKDRALRLHPITLAHAAAMEALGCDLGAMLDDAHALIAAWLLTKEPQGMAGVVGDLMGATREAQEWMKGRTRQVARIAKAVNGLLVASFRTFVPPKKEEGTTTCAPTGLGWPLEIAECLCGEYGWTLDHVLATPLSTAFALVSASRQRHGGEHGGPDYYERIMIEEMKALDTRKAKEATDGGRRE